jgi:hypothetical protein
MAIDSYVIYLSFFSYRDYIVSNGVGLGSGMVSRYEFGMRHFIREEKVVAVCFCMHTNLKTADI